MTPLVVAALDEEARHVPTGFEVVVTGVGKTRAAAALARRLAQGPAPTVVVNVGTAGTVAPDTIGVIEVGYVTQHDFPYDEIEALLATQLSRGYLLEVGQPPRPAAAAPAGGIALATGDRFVADAETARRIATARVHLVDMEGYGFAAVCAEFAVPFRCVKAVSDGADAAAAPSWLDAVDGCARGLGDWLSREFAGVCHNRDG